MGSSEASSFNTGRIDHLYQDPHDTDPRLILHYGDLTDSTNLIRIIQQVHPDEIYNLGAQSHVAVSFDTPEYTANSDALGTLRILEAVRMLGLTDKTRIYQASTSELYGLVQEIPQRESTPFYPPSPAVAKLYAYWITVNYRESYGMYACNGVLFNHESPRRGETFVTRKITRGLCRIDTGIEECLHMGNPMPSVTGATPVTSRCNGGCCSRIIQDFVIATGRQESVRRFIELAAVKIGWGSIIWEGEALEEVGRRADSGAVVVRIDPRYFRPSEVETLLGIPPRRARNWDGPPRQRWRNWYRRWWRQTTKRHARKQCISMKDSKFLEDANDPDLWFRQDRYIWCTGDGWQCHFPGVASARLSIVAETKQKCS